MLSGIAFDDAVIRRGCAVVKASGQAEMFA
jgi:hypothetical protein